MDPPQSVYSKRVLYSTFDLGPLLKPGTNTVGALLGNYKLGYTDLWCNMTTTGPCQTRTTPTLTPPIRGGLSLSLSITVSPRSEAALMAAAPSSYGPWSTLMTERRRSSGPTRRTGLLPLGLWHGITS